jgi:hypothetical protein
MRNFTYLSNFYFLAYTVIFRIALAPSYILFSMKKIIYFISIFTNETQNYSGFKDSKDFPESDRHISCRDTFPNESFQPGGSFSGLWIHRPHPGSYLGRQG